jgi:excisionase family DNA binding protein
METAGATRLQIACAETPTPPGYFNRLLPIITDSSSLPKLDYLNNNLERMLMTEPWTSVEGIALHLGVAKDSIYRWIDRRYLPAHRIGRLWKFKISEVDEWVRGNVADSVPRDKRDRR